MKEESVKKMKVSDLRAALTLRGLSTEGLKVDLVNRLQARLDEEEFGMVDAPVVPVAPMLEPESISLVPAAAPAVAVAAVAPLDNDPEPETTTGMAEKVPAVVESPELTDSPEVVGKGATTTVENHATSKVTAPITTTKEASTISTKNTTSSTTGQTVVLPKITPDMSFEEKRRIRAARFNMTLVEETNTKNATGRADTKTTTNNNNNRSIDTKRGSKNVVVAEEGKAAKKAKVDTVVEKEEEELLPKEEIERRLKRLQKFSGEANQLAMDKLKAMLRKYRFMQKE